MKEKISEFVRHNQGLVAGLAICAVILVWGFGCQPKVDSPFVPGQKVTRAQLTAQAENYADATAAAYDDLDQQEAIRSAILEAGLAYAQGGGINPLGLAGTLMGILGLGVVVDNRKKDAVIKSKDNALASFKVGDKTVTVADTPAAT